MSSWAVSCEHHLCKALDLNRHEMVSIVGGGGKTTAMFRLLMELNEEETPGAVAASTCKIRLPSEDPVFPPAETLIPKTEHVAIETVKSIESDKPVAEEDLDVYPAPAKPCQIPSVAKYLPNTRHLVVLGGSVQDAKVKGINPTWLNSVYEATKMSVIVEADGARCLPLKAPGASEPVIPSATTTVISVIGISAFGKPIKDTVFRPEQFCSITGAELDDNVSTNLIPSLINHKNGAFQNAGPNRRIVVINQADVNEDLGDELACLIMQECPLISSVVVGSLQSNQELLVWRRP